MKILIPIILMFIFSCEDDGVSPSYGCMDSNAANYDGNANVDDGSCNSIYTYTNHIKPILDNHCIECHFGQSPMYGNLNLTSYDDMMNGGDSGELINLNDIYENTLLWIRIDDGGMPPSENLDEQSMNIFRRWIEQGAIE